MDGRGNSLADFDDPNVPSLLSIPLLGYAHYNASIYAATRARILSRKNSWYFEGSALRGLGSPHTPSGHVWPLAMAVQVLISQHAMSCRSSEINERRCKIVTSSFIWLASDESPAAYAGLCAP